MMGTDKFLVAEKPLLIIVPDGTNSALTVALTSLKLDTLSIITAFLYSSVVLK
jgi:hypothetical protein